MGSTVARPTELERTRQPATERTRGLVSAPVRAGDIASQLRPAPAQLSDVVARMWGAQWDLRGHDPHRTQLLGDPCVHVVFEAGASRLVGVWTQLWQRTLSDAGRIRAATIHAGAIRALLPAPA
ncbi:MAG: hypothetical protein K0V04_18470, partial [Deltaproteobacteria bacterium]|nr:hypothetical protein [Deltaproteobacteria bacterium]